ncbi:MAG: alpha/beta hydrolase fold domain-containing protein [Marmoricola sp.]
MRITPVALNSPSIRHRLVTEVVRRTRRSGDLGDPATFRDRFLASSDRVPRRIPADFPESALSSDALKVLQYVPAGVAPARTLVHLHGGGYTNPADPRQFAFLRRLADELGVRLLFPLYPLAPEHTWRDSRSLLVEMVSQAAAESAEGVVLTGDSAGGGYALSVAQGVRDAGGTMPTHLVLISPWVDLSADVPGREEAAANDPWLTLPQLHVYAAWWAGSEADRSLPEVSPALGDLNGLPRTLAMVGTRDLLHPENVALAGRAKQAGWDYTFVEAPGLIHVYPLLPVPEAKPACRQIVDFLRR